MLDQLSSFSSCKFYQSCKSSSGLLNLCLYNFGKECPKVQWFFLIFCLVQSIAIKLFHTYLWMKLPAVKEAYTMHQMRVPWCFPFQQYWTIWIPSVSVTHWIQSFITWDSICISWHPNLVFVIPNVNLSFFTKVCITSFSFPESENWFWLFLTLPFHFFAFLLVDLSSWSQISKWHNIGLHLGLLIFSLELLILQLLLLAEFLDFQIPVIFSSPHT